MNDGCDRSQSQYGNDIMNSEYLSYVLLTAARNEEEYIENVIISVMAQSRRPRKWVIVSDGSTDETDRIVRSYESKTDFIVFARRDDRSGSVDFARKVQALRHGQSMLEDLSYGFIGNLDADITFDAGYFETLLGEFREHPKLGIAGGTLYEPVNGRFMPRYLSEPQYVPGAVQLFRRACFEQIGGYALSRWGERIRLPWSRRGWTGGRRDPSPACKRITTRSEMFPGASGGSAFGRARCSMPWGATRCSN